jgi:hypothetical protein
MAEPMGSSGFFSDSSSVGSVIQLEVFLKNQKRSLRQSVPNWIVCQVLIEQ